MPSAKGLKTHFSYNDKTLCGAKIAAKTSTDRSEVDCKNCIGLFSTLPVVVSVPTEESFSEKFDKEFPEPTETPEPGETPEATYEFPEGFEVSATMAPDPKKPMKNASDTITRLVTLSPHHIHRLGNWNARTQFPDESIKQLAHSILKNGLMVPLIVFQENGYYYLIDGERRLRAILWLCANGNPVQSVNCIVSKKVSDAERILAALITSAEKEPLPPIDEANAFQRLRNLSWKVEDIAERTGRKPAYITRHLKMLQANPTLLRQVNEKAVSVGEIFRILKLAETGISQQEAAEKVLSEAADGRTREAKEQKAREEKEKADREKLAKINVRRIARGLEPLTELPTGEVSEETPGEVSEETPGGVSTVSPEDEKEFQAALDYSHGVLQEAHENASTTPPTVPPLAHGDYTVTGSSTVPVEPPQKPARVQFNPSDEYARLKAQGKPTDHLTNPYNRMDAMMSLIFIDCPEDVATPTIHMALRWLVRATSVVAVSTALEEVVKEEKAAASKVIAPPMPAAVPARSNIGSIAKVVLPTKTGAPGSAQAGLTGETAKP